MKLRPRRREDPDINMTSLIDVVFLLLLFFLLSTTFDRQSEIRIDLPKASPEQEQATPDTVTLTIDAAGEFYVNGRHVVNRQLESVKRALRTVIAAGEKPPLVISADATTPHQAVVTAMDAARQLGLVHVSIATRQPADGQR